MWPRLYLQIPSHTVKYPKHPYSDNDRNTPRPTVLYVEPKKPASWTVLELERKKPVNCPDGKVTVSGLRPLQDKLLNRKFKTMRHPENYPSSSSSCFSSSSSFLFFLMGGRRKADATGKMTQLCRKIVRANIKLSILERVTIFQKFFRFIWDRLVVCSVGKPIRYRRLSRRSPPPSPSPEKIESGLQPEELSTAAGDCDSDLVRLKICVMGDCQIGKTSFLFKYVGDEEEKTCLQMTGLNLMGKTLVVQGARIAFSLWDVGGDHTSLTHVPIACKDAVAILFMFDLTSRCTLNSVIGWYSQARRWNQAAIPIMIGTKFDDFVKLPADLQRPIVTQARGYARAMKATLFFSSATHNINVNKIFKFIMAKLFNLPWTPQRNLTIGEPIIDF